MGCTWPTHSTSASERVSVPLPASISRVGTSRARRSNAVRQALQTRRQRTRCSSGMTVLHLEPLMVKMRCTTSGGSAGMGLRVARCAVRRFIVGWECTKERKTPQSSAQGWHLCFEIPHAVPWIRSTAVVAPRQVAWRSRLTGQVGLHKRFKLYELQVLQRVQLRAQPQHHHNNRPRGLGLHPCAIDFFPDSWELVFQPGQGKPPHLRPCSLGVR